MRKFNKLILFPIFVIVSHFLTCCSDTQKEQPMLSSSNSPGNVLIGEWIGQYKDEKISIIFNEKDLCTLIEGNKVIEGKWELDSEQDPMHLDFVIKEESGEILKIFGIAKFLTEKKLFLHTSLEERPAGFDKQLTRRQIVFSKQ